MRRVLVPFDVLLDWLPENPRGCSFVNAFAELPEPDHPAHQVIVEEKEWLRAVFRTLLAEAGVTESETLSLQLLSLHEGAIVSYATTDEQAAPTSARAAARALVEQRLNT